MPEKNKLADVKKSVLKKIFNDIKRGKRSVADAAVELEVHPSTIRYHLNKEVAAEA